MVKKQILNKISAPTWNEELKLPDASYFMRYSRLFWIYLKKHGEKTDTPWTRIFFSKIENRMIFNIKRCDIISNF